MSYAAVAGEHTDGPQPTADPALLNLQPTATELPDVEKKVTVVDSDFKENPRTETSDKVQKEAAAAAEASAEGKKAAKSKAASYRAQAGEYLEEAEEEAQHLWALAKQRLFQPGVLGGLLGLVNVGLIGGVGYALYTHPHLRHDYRKLSILGTSLLAIGLGEGAVAEAYRKTDAGKKEEAKARKEGAALYRHAKEIVLRPGVFGGILGVINLGVLGGVGYAAYKYFHGPKWDRRIVSAVSVGLIGFLAGEGYIAEQYREKELPKHK
ncbi:hypothetical protein DACRYDRAFT_20903 [Dacryopinax primogenitus]|uniref:Mitochondrial outer membrane protein OM14 C-terminal domain-containing protein n=1 Tax=Dacryopinax primogenitus (strain DJM 731) TaxID=1858805 RepID=M5G870_DACPD|nr:uncharacterized protein DACRYDRAFT_20903 [Dacryopinax primogenitus]EJU04340.1 hypothetical protein DACRYDRAFT_20903 [Dacryopinax primogenitus]